MATLMKGLKWNSEKRVYEDVDTIAPVPLNTRLSNPWTPEILRFLAREADLSRSERARFNHMADEWEQGVWQARTTQ